MLRILITSFETLTLLMALTTPLLSAADPVFREHRPGNPHVSPGHPISHPGRPFPKRPRPARPPSYPNHPGFGPRVPGHLYTPPPRNPHNLDEVDAAEIIADSIQNRGCDRAGEALRQISNLLLDSAKFETSDNPPPVSRDPRDRMRHANHYKWRARLRSPEFIKLIFERLAAMYRECNRECFDDGLAIGQISGTGYCAASVGVGGLNGPGFQTQLPMPVCATATFVGCQEGFDEAASSFEGCGNYTEGGFTDIFNESKSQDCHMD